MLEIECESMRVFKRNNPWSEQILWTTTAGEATIFSMIFRPLQRVSTAFSRVRNESVDCITLAFGVANPGRRLNEGAGAHARMPAYGRTRMTRG